MAAGPPKYGGHPWISYLLLAYSSQRDRQRLRGRPSSLWAVLYHQQGQKTRLGEDD